MDRRHHSSRIGDSNGRLSTRRDVKAVALLLKVVHLALTRLRQRLRVDGSHAVDAAATVRLHVVLHVEVAQILHAGERLLLQQLHVLVHFVAPAVGSLGGQVWLISAACQSLTV